MAEAEHLAASVVLGEHGRRRAGMGETFWQYRRAEPGDGFAEIDWRRSARSDRLYIRQTEWEAAQNIMFWVDPSQAMNYRSREVEESKATRAAILTLALAVLMNRAGERFALIGTPAGRPRRGRQQVEAMANALVGHQDAPDYGAPPVQPMSRGARAVFFSDFMGPRESLVTEVSKAADQGVRGCLVQVLDPTEESFPFDGRTRFQSMGGTVEYEVDRARSLKDAYIEKLARRKDELSAIARRTGWLYLDHSTATPARAALLWLHGAVSGDV